MYLQFKKRQYTYLDELRVITSNYNYYIYNVYCNLTRSTRYLEHKFYFALYPGIWTAL